MTPENRKLVQRIKPLLRQKLPQREIAKRLKVSPGRVQGVIYRHIDKV